MSKEKKKTIYYTLGALLLVGAVAVTFPGVHESIGIKEEGQAYTKLLITVICLVFLGLGFLLWTFMGIDYEPVKEKEVEKEESPMRDPQDIVDEIHKLEKERDSIDEKIKVLYWVFGVEEKKGKDNENRSSGSPEIKSEKTPPGM